MACSHSPSVRYGTQESNAVCTSNRVTSTQRHHRGHGLTKGFLDLLHHPTTGELFNSVRQEPMCNEGSTRALPRTQC